MNVKVKIKSLTAVLPGWWAKFSDYENKTEWYSPVAAWALCEVEYEKHEDTFDEVLPVLTGENGMNPHHYSEGSHELLYLPDKKFSLSEDDYCYSWVMISDPEGS